MREPTVIPFPGQPKDDNSVFTALQIETAMNNLGSIITLLQQTVEGERFAAARAYLTEELDSNFGVLDQLLSARGA